jgi:hypothetical protein
LVILDPIYDSLLFGLILLRRDVSSGGQLVQFLKPLLDRWLGRRGRSGRRGRGSLLDAARLTVGLVYLSSGPYSAAAYHTAYNMSGQHAAKKSSAIMAVNLGDKATVLFRLATLFLLIVFISSTS